MKLTRSHPVARAMKAGLSMKQAWAAYKRGRNPTGKPGTGLVRRPVFYRSGPGTSASAFVRATPRKGWKPKRRRNPTMASLVNPRRRRRKARRRNPLYRTRSGRFTGRKTRRRLKRKRSGGWRGNPLRALNPSRRRRSRRRGRRRNPGIIRMFNPFGGGIVRKVVSRVKTAASPRTLAQVAGGTTGFVVSWAAPAYLVPQHDVGWKGIGISAGAGVAASILVGMVAPSYAPVVLLGGLIGTAIKAIMQNARGVLFPQAGMAGFLTIRRGMGQIPQNLLAGGMGEFLETKQNFAAMGPTSAAAFGAPGRYSNNS